MKRIVYTNKKGETTTSYAAAQAMGATKITYEPVDTRSEDYKADQEKWARKRMSAYGY
jgi:hypothetical protein